MPVERGGSGDARSSGLATLGAVAAAADAGAPGAPYLAQHRLFDQIPELAWPLGPLLGVAPAGAVAAAWVGADTATPAHYDPVHNLVAQVLGVKRWRLWAPRATPPPAAAAPDVAVALGPGDALFVPSGWWHAVDCAGAAIAVRASRVAPSASRPSL